VNKNAIRAGIVLIICGLISVGLVAATASSNMTFMGYPALLVCAVVAFVVQWLAFVPAYLKQTEKFYDLCGSGTFLLVTIVALYLASPPSIYQWVLGLMVIVWALRLGSFLFTRIHQDGADDRFDEMKPNKYRFFSAWTIQGLWVLITSAAAVTAITSINQPPITWISIVGVSLWLFGLTIEVIADRQKRNFKKQPASERGFITTGLWAYSRHPNYLGEILLWIGVAVAAMPALAGWQYIVVCSPLFVILLLVKVSGIPLLESKAEKKWGGNKDYEAYKAGTSLLIPKVW
jgi:steroid 5-alpha reductase family enzyme